MLDSVVCFAFSYVACGAFHEAAHLAAAAALGHSTTGNAWAACFKRSVRLPGLQGYARSIVAHAGWLASVVVCAAIYAMRQRVAGGRLDGCAYAACLTAVEAVASDLMGISRAEERLSDAAFFGCGNFGMILLDACWQSTASARTSALDVLEKMVAITMVRGAQSGGVVTFVDSKGDVQGLRSRVVNAKRTDLSKLVRRKLEKDEAYATPLPGVKFYAGHTRFATTSKATFDGTHPHQWSPAQKLDCYDGFDEGVVSLNAVARRFEVFICHNGDLDFFQVGARTYDLALVQQWLIRATGCEMPSAVDSCAVAGLLDLHRAQSCWALSARFGFLFGPARQTLDYHVPPNFAEIGKVFDAAFSHVAKSCGSRRVQDVGSPENRRRVAEEARKRLQDFDLFPSTPGARVEDVEGGSEDLGAMCVAAVDAFFDNDLLWSTRLFLKHAKGSFGLMVSCTLDARRQVVLAARGQTMSVAVYPKLGLALYASEQAAVKAAMGVDKPAATAARGQVVPAAKYVATDDPHVSADGDRYGDGAVRVDLDDLGGEVCLVDWSTLGRPSWSRENRALTSVGFAGGKCTLTLHAEASKQPAMAKRLLPLDDNPLILPLPPDSDDPVGTDISDIPRVLHAIQEDWNGGVSMNRFAAWHFGRKLKDRLLRRSRGDLGAHAVDVLVTGCEVSLWLGEQFSSDLQMCLTALNVKTVSANKILGLFGQDFAAPQTGHCFSEGAWDLRETIVVIVSHSGGTFSPLAVSNLLQSSTRSIFLVSGEWDTQVGKQLRKLGGGIAEARVFSTGVGIRPAEPCTVSVAATHQLLTQILIHAISVVLPSPALRKAAGASPSISDAALSEFGRCNVNAIGALEGIVGVSRTGEVLPDSPTALELRARGVDWARHVLEVPKAWAIVAGYIIASVTSGWPIVTLVTSLCGGGNAVWHSYLTRFFDAILYVWLAEVVTAGIRVRDGRNVWHRMGGRTVVIGDVPWVAQSAEAFLSKCFACSYACSGLSVASGNPADHLVHRFTHRVARGTLLAVGRPDGRLSALASAEAAACLGTNQASSIQSLGVTCESLTIGHNPSKLPLTKHAVFLPGARPKYLCEQLLSEELVARGELGPGEDLPQMSVGALLGEYMSLRAREAATSPGDEGRTVLENLMQFNKTEDPVLKRRAELRAVFDAIDTDGGGTLDEAEFAAALRAAGGDYSNEQASKLFKATDADDDGTLDFEEFFHASTQGDAAILASLQCANVSTKADVRPSDEAYFGEKVRRTAPPKMRGYSLVESQTMSMRLYESRIASLERAVAFYVLFHSMSSTVANWWKFCTLGVFQYRIDRTHSIMRIATTASPVSGADVRERMREIEIHKSWHDVFDLLTKFKNDVIAQQRIRTKFKNKNDVIAQQRIRTEVKKRINTPCAATVPVAAAPEAPARASDVGIRDVGCLGIRDVGCLG
ncbi:hypothetical protein M885DRAFT_522003 [Pelagophyceae sp. CCMP2097]|nr:hypothetical protein M885DRAFT_522003 [Pelagophyceae sp. CCMP2097]